MILLENQSLKVVQIEPDGSLLAGFVGRFLYDPPVLNKDGSYTPGEWTVAVSPECFHKGYHVTKNPSRWWRLSNPGLYLAEFRGKSSDPGSGCAAHESIRLLRPLTIEEMHFFGVEPK